MSPILRRTGLVMLALIVGVALGFVAGEIRGLQGRWPSYLIADALTALRTKPAQALYFDNYGRLVGYPGKTAIDCPAQDDRTAVIVAFGQSNASNELGERGVSRHGDDIVSWFDGVCQRAVSPLLGTSGMRGELWTELANKLIESGLYDRVILVPMAIGGTSIRRWTTGGDLNAMMKQQLGLLAGRYRPTALVWVQGEDDWSGHMSGDDYRRHFLAMVAGLRGQGIDAPIYVTRATFCAPDEPWQADNPIATALAKLPDAAIGLFAGVDSDALIPEADRMDGCHFGGRGVATFTNAMRDIIAMHVAEVSRHGTTPARH